ncbi:MarR family winged helix-turn-helix transcriptional regulator [Sphingomonas flavalba]|uniref:MarR family winged helix-turn-helix transcriptional regulator n=1 Tax=Sphingomonas flavalba TaxID=2559804 RepID=UPI00109DBA72|nr:MarR family winged helix-turn-helix transcriptional regulator [Sphingomonas flavalba]
MPLTVSRPELLVNGSDELFRQVIHDALGFSARLQEIRGKLGEVIGLSGPAYSILIAIEYLGKCEEVGVSRVSEHLHLSGAFVTIEVGKLAKAGLVDKRGHPEDGRRVILTVTAKGHALLDTLAETQRPVNDTIFAMLDDKQFAAFAEIIALLVNGTEDALALLHLLSEQRRRRA